MQSRRLAAADDRFARPDVAELAIELATFRARGSSWSRRSRSSSSTRSARSSRRHPVVAIAITGTRRAARRMRSSDRNPHLAGNGKRRPRVCSTVTDAVRTNCLGSALPAGAAGIALGGEQTLDKLNSAASQQGLLRARRAPVRQRARRSVWRRPCSPATAASCPRPHSARHPTACRADCAAMSGLPAGCNCHRRRG